MKIGGREGPGLSHEECVDVNNWNTYTLTIINFVLGGAVVSFTGAFVTNGWSLYSGTSE